MSSIRFVCVPQPSGSLSVLVVPRLDGSLADAGMADWAAAIASAPLEVATDAGTNAPVRVVSAPDPAHWRRTFPADTDVRPPVLPVYDDVEVEASTETLERVSSTYTASARAIVEEGAGDDTTVREELERWQAEETVESPAPGDGTWTGADFHRAVSLLREHPAVMRALGLVFDVQPPAGLLRASGRVRVRWPGNALIVSPWTAYERTSRGYAPAAAGDITGGMVDVSGPSWRVTSLDVDGAAGRLRDAARAVAADLDAVATLPTLRSQGLALLRAGRGEQLARRRDAGARRDADAEQTLTAEDLVLGYRVDVRRQGAPWRTVTSRLATYRLNGELVGAEAGREDAHVKANTATRQGSGALRADEIVTRWDGWNLAVPRPVTGRARSLSARRADLPFDLDTELSVAPGSLPALRFGSEYQLRLRVADVTGGGPSAGAPEGDACATRYETYLRYEPVLPPGVDASEPTTAPGEAVDELVIRSDRGVDTVAFAAEHPEYAATTKRSLRPPTTSLRIAEEHGALDDAADDVLRDAAVAAAIEDPAAGGVLLVVRDEPGTDAAGVSIDERWGGSWPQRAEKSLLLSTAEPGTPRMEWRDGVARVRLAPADQLTLDVSSFLTADARGDFAISEWLRTFPPSAVTTGTHPMVSPARPVRLVHAVRRPLADPSGTLEPARTPAATRVQLSPTHPTMGVDVASTAQIDLRATWREWTDSATPDEVADTLPAIELPRGTAAIPAIVHEFADTKHRRVTYSATAASRFRRYFADSDPADAFVAAASLGEVRIPSSAPPPRPVVRSVSPAFRWSGADAPAGWSTLTRTRAGGILRVELDRPWFETGEGERLAVLVWDAAAPPEPTAQVTRAGRDPIRAARPLLAFPPVSVFAGAADATFHQGDVTAVPYDVWAAEDAWWADVHVPGIAASSYSPLIQLVVARYQADSLPGMRLSEPVIAPPATVLPDRTVTVTRSGGSVSVVLAGTSAPAPTNSVRVSIEEDYSGGGDALDVTGASGVGWRTVAAVTGAVGARIDIAAPAAGRAQRLVVRETEDIPGDPATDELPLELVTRSVFLDVIPL